MTDTERLNWLEKNWNEIDFISSWKEESGTSSVTAGQYKVMVQRDYWTITGKDKHKTLREAVDWAQEKNNG